MPRRLLLAAALAVAVTGCGAGSGAWSAADRAGAATASATGASVTVSARPDTATGSLEVTAVVTGPAELFGGCQPTLAVHLVDPSGAAVPLPAHSPALQCLAINAISIAAGETRVFSAALPLPAGHGTFTVVGMLRGGGDLPPMTISL